MHHQYSSCAIEDNYIVVEWIFKQTWWWGAVSSLNNGFRCVVRCVSIITLLVTEIFVRQYCHDTTEQATIFDICHNRQKYEHLITLLKSKHSFPSGDTAQAMNLCMILCRYVIPSSCDSSSSTAGVSIVSMPLINRFVFLFRMFLPGVLLKCAIIDVIGLRL